jgi:uncharacterized membrane protein
VFFYNQHYPKDDAPHWNKNTVLGGALSLMVVIVAVILIVVLIYIFLVRRNRKITNPKTV